MTESELEIVRLRMRMAIVERMALKHAIEMGILLGRPLEDAARSVLRSIQPSDGVIQSLWRHKDAAEFALLDAEFREVIEHMQHIVTQVLSDIRDEIGTKHSVFGPNAGLGPEG